jgi:ammonium transporter Rh
MSARQITNESTEGEETELTSINFYPEATSTVTKPLVPEQKTSTAVTAISITAADEAQEARIAALLSAASKNNIERVLHWIRAGVDASSADYDYRSALHIAASEGHLEVLQELIKEGANVHAKDRFGSTPLDDAIHGGHRVCAETLKLAGATHGGLQKLEARLITAAANGSLDEVRTLLETTPSLVNCADYDRRTALHLSIAEGHVEVAKLLLQYGANAKAEDRFGVTPLYEAQKHAVRTGSDPLRDLFEDEIEHERAPLLSKFVVIFGSFEVAMIILIGLFIEYTEFANGSGDPTAIEGRLEYATTYPLWQDIHVMIFIGFGFLMTFLRKNAYTAVGFTLLTSALVIQWYLLNRTFWHGVYTSAFHKLRVDIVTLATADFCAGSVMISFGAVLGKVSPFQILSMAVWEVIFYSINEHLGILVFKAADVGGTITLHMFGAFFGLAFSRMVSPRGSTGNRHNAAVYHSDTFAMIGTIFLWLFWPSFNAALATGNNMYRSSLNTLFSMCGSCVAAFLASYALRREKGFNMVDIQNATLAGGVAIGACCDQLIQPGAALAIGTISGIVSVWGYVYLQTWVEKHLNVHDTCGVLNLHGLPSLIGGFASVISVYAVDFGRYNQGQIDLIIPGNASRTGSKQAAYQFAYICTTMGISLASGFVAGWFMKFAFFEPISAEKLYEDRNHWECPKEETPYFFDHRGEIARGAANAAHGEQESANQLLEIERANTHMQQQMIAMQRQLQNAEKRAAAAHLHNSTASPSIASSTNGGDIVMQMNTVFERLLERLEKTEKRE